MDYERFVLLVDDLIGTAGARALFATDDDSLTEKAIARMDALRAMVLREYKRLYDLTLKGTVAPVAERPELDIDWESLE